MSTFIMSNAVVKLIAKYCIEITLGLIACLSISLCVYTAYEIATTPEPMYNTIGGTILQCDPVQRCEFITPDNKLKSCTIPSLSICTISTPCSVYLNANEVCEPTMKYEIDTTGLGIWIFMSIYANCLLFAVIAFALSIKAHAKELASSYQVQTKGSVENPLHEMI